VVIPPAIPSIGAVTSIAWLEHGETFLPAILVGLYFVGGFALFTLRSLMRGVPRDPEMEARGDSMLVGSYLRNFFVWVVRPLWLLVLGSGLSANALTTIAAAIGLASGVAVGLGSFALGGWLLLFSGILDALDGRLARARGQVTPAGSALDSVLDRYVDGAILAGLAWYFRETWVLLPTLAAITGTSLVSYVRAKADSLGVTMRDGLMQRPERILYLGGTIAFSPMVEAVLAPTGAPPAHRLAIFGIIFLAITSNLTALGRLLRLLAALKSRFAQEIQIHPGPEGTDALDGAGGGESGVEAPSLLRT
jgi:phosphatidylglycerophosphate synthase